MLNVGVQQEEVLTVAASIFVPCAMCWWTSVDLSGYLISVPVQTMQLQQWNQPRGRSVDFIPVDKLGARRRELLPQKDRTYGSHDF